MFDYIFELSMGRFEVRQNEDDETYRLLFYYEHGPAETFVDGLSKKEAQRLEERLTSLSRKARVIITAIVNI